MAWLIPMHQSSFSTLALAACGSGGGSDECVAVQSCCVTASQSSARNTQTKRSSWHVVYVVRSLNRPADAENGAGQVDMNLSKQILDNHQYTMRESVDSSFVTCGAGCREYFIANVSVSATQKLRTALVWQACMTSETGPVAMNNNLDLVVKGSTSFRSQYYGNVTRGSDGSDGGA